jgi:predicted lysophospholipase L1 biosynthesis ABC-type transport system permease subunit
MPHARAAEILQSMDDNDFGFGFWVKVAGLFVVGAIALLVFMWLFLSAIYAWGFFAAFLVLALGALALGWIHDRRNAGQYESSS